MTTLLGTLKLGESTTISQKSVQCCISWRRLQLAAHPDLRLTAVLLDAEGERLDVVSRELRENAPNVAQQWEACGVKHIAVAGHVSSDHAGPALEGNEEIALDFGQLSAAPLLNFVVLVVRAPGLPALRELAAALLEVKDVGRKLDLIADEQVKDCNHTIAYIFCRERDSQNSDWSIVDVRVPVAGGEALDADFLKNMAKSARSKVADSTVRLPQEQDLKEEIATLCREGRHAEAVKKQEMLVQIVVGDSARSPTATSEAIDFLSELQQRASGSLASSSAVASDAARTLATEQNLTAVNRIEQAKIEPLDDCGYQEVKHLEDAAAMTEYISRVVSANGLRIDDMDVMKLVTAAMPATYEQLLAALRGEAGGKATVEALEGSPEQQPAQISIEGKTIRASSSSAGAQSDAVTATGTCHGSKSLGHRILLPPGGSTNGGCSIQWVADGPMPEDLRIAGRPCAAMGDGVFVTPLSRKGKGLQVVTAIFADGSSQNFADGFCYWEVGRLVAVDPDRGPLRGGCEICITTNDLGAAITEVLIGGTACDLMGKPSATSAQVVLPPVDVDGAVSIEVRAANGNAASAADAFFYYPPEAFGFVGHRIELSDDNKTARRTEGITGGVCIGAFPLKRSVEGRYFELILTEWVSSLKAMAIGVSAKQDAEAILCNGHVIAEEARELSRVWLAGYDSRGALFINDEAVTSIPENSWRPARHLRPNAEQTPIRLGVLWSEPADELSATPSLVIFQDGIERVRLPAGGRLPSRSEDIYALVDLQGSVKCASIVEGATPPQQVSVEAT